MCFILSQSLFYFIRLCFFMKLYSIIPKNPQEMISPIPTVSIKYAIEPSKLYTYESTKGIISVFDIIGGNIARYLFFLNKYVPIAPIRVAMLPNIISSITAPDKKFAIMQPTNSPPIAYGVKQGIMHKPQKDESE